MPRVYLCCLEDPFSGSRPIVFYLARDGIPISHDPLLRNMGRISL